MKASNILNKIISDGKLGYNKGLPTGIQPLDDMLMNLYRKTYYLIAANSGHGKTTLADFVFLIKARQQAKLLNLPYKAVYFSLEIPIKDKLPRLYSTIISETTNYPMTKAKIEHRSRFGLDPYEEKLVNDNYPTIDELIDNNDFSDYINTVDNIRARILDRLNTMCDVKVTFTTGAVNILRPTIFDKTLIQNPELIREVEILYKKDPATGVSWELGYFFVFIDHIGLIKHKQGQTLKQAIDELSFLMVEFRNIYGISPVVIQQLNSGASGAGKQLASAKTPEQLAFMAQNFIVPSQNDLGDSTYTFRDCNIFLGIVSPKRLVTQLSTYEGSPLDGNLGMITQWLYLIKGRETSAPAHITVTSNGATGTYYLGVGNNTNARLTELMTDFADALADKRNINYDLIIKRYTGIIREANWDSDFKQFSK